jgi:hypothetical protein
MPNDDADLLNGLNGIAAEIHEARTVVSDRLREIENALGDITKKLGKIQDSLTRSLGSPIGEGPLVGALEEIAAHSKASTARQEGTAGRPEKNIAST